MPANGPIGAIAAMHMYLAAMSRNSFSICNNLQLSQSALIQLNEAHICEVQKNQDIVQRNEVLRTRLGERDKEIFDLRSFIASLEKDCYETQMINQSMKLLLDDLQRVSY